MPDSTMQKDAVEKKYSIRGIASLLRNVEGELSPGSIASQLRKEFGKDDIIVIADTALILFSVPFLALFAAKGNVDGTVAMVLLEMAGFSVIAVKPDAFVEKSRQPSH